LHQAIHFGTNHTRRRADSFGNFSKRHAKEEMNTPTTNSAPAGGQLVSVVLVDYRETGISVLQYFVPDPVDKQRQRSPDLRLRGFKR